MDNSRVATTFSNASSLPSAGTALRRTTPNRTIPPSLPRVSTTTKRPMPSPAGSGSACSTPPPDTPSTGAIRGLRRLHRPRETESTYCLIWTKPCMRNGFPGGGRANRSGRSRGRQAPRNQAWDGQCLAKSRDDIWTTPSPGPAPHPLRTRIIPFLPSLTGLRSPLFRAHHAVIQPTNSFLDDPPQRHRLHSRSR